MKPDGRIRIGCIPIRSVPNSGIGWEHICSNLNDVVGYLIFDFVFCNNIQYIAIALTLGCLDVVIGLVTICVLCHVGEFWKQWMNGVHRTNFFGGLMCQQSVT